MSSQRGNASRTRAQKYRNETAYKNDMHDTSKRTEFINSLEITETCKKCKDIIDWKVKYKKYKPLKAPTRCTKCEQKTVKRAYHTICQGCAAKLGICAKCGMSEEIVARTKPTEQEQAKINSRIEQMIKNLPVRKQRTIFRHLSKKEKIDGSARDSFSIEALSPLSMEEVEKLVKNLTKLKKDDDDDLIDDFDECSIGDSD